MPSSSSTTTVLELPILQTSPAQILHSSSVPASSKEYPYVVTSGRTLSSEIATDGILPSPTTATPRLARWNSSRTNVLRVLGTFYSFIILGANDAAYGAMNPYLQQYYHVDDTIVSLVFLSPTVGYVLSALTNNFMHNQVGQRGVAFISSLSHIVAYVVICLHPPYPALVCVFMIAGYGNGLADSAWNAWLGDMANANEVLGFLHGFYGLGAALAPLTATSLITKAGWHWYEFYYLMVGAAVIELFALVSSFWNARGSDYRAQQARTADEFNDSGNSTPVKDDHRGQQQHQQSWYARFNPLKTKSSSSKAPSRTVQAIKNRVSLTTALFLLVYVGIEVSIGGWIVVFMLRIRDATPFASGLSSTGFWLGITVGRLVLGFVTPRLFRSEKHAIAAYLTVSVALQLLFWLIPNFLVSAVMVGLLGFFLAPLFPAAVVVLTKLLPKRLHVASIGFAAALGASGACIFPFAVGAIANAKGVQTLQPIILAMLVIDLIVWLCLPKLPKQRMN